MSVFTFRTNIKSKNSKSVDAAQQRHDARAHNIKAT